MKNPLNFALAFIKCFVAGVTESRCSDKRCVTAEEFSSEFMERSLENNSVPPELSSENETKNFLNTSGETEHQIFPNSEIGIMISQDAQRPYDRTLTEVGLDTYIDDINPCLNNQIHEAIKTELSKLTPEIERNILDELWQKTDVKLNELTKEIDRKNEFSRNTNIAKIIIDIIKIYCDFRNHE